MGHGNDNVNETLKNGPAISVRNLALWTRVMGHDPCEKKSVQRGIPCCSGKKEALLVVACVCVVWVSAVCGCGVVRCCAVLCVVLCCVVLCCVVLCCVVLCCVVLCFWLCVCVAHSLKITVYTYI